MHGSRRPYQQPRVADYGDLWALTATAHPVLGVAASQDMSFSSARAGPGSGVLPLGASNGGVGRTGSDPGVGTQGFSASGAGGSGAHGGGAGGGGHGGGGTLPFTGLAVGAVAAAGTGLVAVGKTLRRITGRRSR